STSLALIQTSPTRTIAPTTPHTTRSWLQGSGAPLYSMPSAVARRRGQAMTGVDNQRGSASPLRETNSTTDQFVCLFHIVAARQLPAEGPHRAPRLVETTCRH